MDQDSRVRTRETGDISLVGLNAPTALLVLHAVDTGIDHVCPGSRGRQLPVTRSPGHSPQQRLLPRLLARAHEAGAVVDAGGRND